MRLPLLVLCIGIAAAVFAAMFGAIWQANRAARGAARSGPLSLIFELLWASIPCAMIMGAAKPAVERIVSGETARHGDLARRVESVSGTQAPVRMREKDDHPRGCLGLCRELTRPKQGSGDQQ